MTYNVYGGTLQLTQLLVTSYSLFWRLSTHDHRAGVNSRTVNAVNHMKRSTSSVTLDCRFRRRGCQACPFCKCFCLGFFIGLINTVNL